VYGVQYPLDCLIPDKLVVAIEEDITRLCDLRCAAVDHIRPAVYKLVEDKVAEATEAQADEYMHNENRG